MFLLFLLAYLILAIVSGVEGALHHTLWCPGGISAFGFVSCFFKLDPYGQLNIFAILTVLITWIAFGVTKIFM